MKITSINTSSSNNSRHKQNFTGVSDSLVKFWQVIDNGGRALQFTVEDMCGTNLPRSYKGAMAGYKYTKKINALALLQEAVREFLTGPTMCLMPVAILKIAKTTMGETANTHIENIKNLSYIMQNTKFASGENFQKDFISHVIEDAISNTAGINTLNKDEVASLTDSIMHYAIFNGKKKDKKALLSEIDKMFQAVIKKHKASYANTDFSEVKYSLSPFSKGSTKFKNYVEYAVNFSKDFSKKYLSGGNIPDNIKSKIVSFRNSWLGKRAVVIACMIGITGCAMSFIPKLYTLVSGSVNPNAKDIYKEAEKKNNGGSKV